MNKLLRNVDLVIGKITYCDFEIKSDLPFEKQKWSFREDLIQINFDNKYLLDVGWYPELNEKGAFLVEVVKCFDWSNPIFEKRTKQLESLQGYIQQAADFINALIKNN